MNSIKWNGTLLFNNGIIVEKIPPITKAKKRITQYTIPGRNGVLNVDNGTYEPFNLSLECHYREDNANIDYLKNWLDGYGRLSLDGVRYYEGVINNNITFDKVQNFRKFILSFMLNPIAKSIDSFTENIDVSQATNTINVGGNYQTYPIINIESTGTVIIRINEITFTLYNTDGTYRLDCSEKEIIKNNQSMSSIMSGDFPYLNPGDNEIFISGDGTITSMSIEYNEAYL